MVFPILSKLKKLDSYFFINKKEESSVILLYLILFLKEST